MSISEIVKNIPERPARTTRSKKEIEADNWKAIINSSLHLLYININDLKSYWACAPDYKAAIKNTIIDYLHYNYSHIEEWPEYEYSFDRDDGDDIKNVIIIFKPFGDTEKDILFVMKLK